MNSITKTMTAQTPSCFAMPISGSTYGAFGIAQGATGAGTLTVVRDRVVADAALVKGAVKGAFPGTSAWRPPTC